MEKFIKKISIFLLLLTGIGIASFYTVSEYLASKASFEINQDVRYVVLGHSHPECAYNDSLIDSFQNLAISGESYFYTLPKLKEIIKSNPEIETVFLEFTNNQISSDINSWIWDEKYLSYHYVIYEPYINGRDKFFIFKHRPKNFIANLPIAFKGNLKKSLSGAKYNIPKEFGGYKYLRGDLFEYQEKMAKEGTDKEDFVEIQKEVSEIQLSYLQEIIDFLKANNIQYYLVRSPEHESYAGSANEDSYQKLLNERFAADPFIDLKDFPLTEEHFRDPEHLNFKGAKILSLWLNDLIKSGLLENGDIRIDHLSLERNL